MAARCLLIATDGSALAGRAVAEGVALAKAVSARVVVLTVVAPLNSMGAVGDMFADQPAPIRQAAIDYLLGEARGILKSAGAVAAAAGIEAELRQVEDAHPHEAILRVARESGADLIVMATHSRSGLAKLVLGSVTQKVLTHADRAVLVCR